MAYEERENTDDIFASSSLGKMDIDEYLSRVLEFSHSETRRLRDVFNSYKATDEKQTKITEEEFGRIILKDFDLTNEEIAQIFNRWDVDKDHFIDFKEYCRMIAQIRDRVNRKVSSFENDVSTTELIAGGWFCCFCTLGLSFLPYYRKSMAYYRESIAQEILDFHLGESSINHT